MPFILFARPQQLLAQLIRCHFLFVSGFANYPLFHHRLHQRQDKETIIVAKIHYIVCDSVILCKMQSLDRDLARFLSSIYQRFSIKSNTHNNIKRNDLSHKNTIVISYAKTLREFPVIAWLSCLFAWFVLIFDWGQARNVHSRCVRQLALKSSIRKRIREVFMKKLFHTFTEIDSGRKGEPSRQRAKAEKKQTICNETLETERSRCQLLLLKQLLNMSMFFPDFLFLHPSLYSTL